MRKRKEGRRKMRGGGSPLRLTLHVETEAAKKSPPMWERPAADSKHTLRETQSTNINSVSAEWRREDVCLHIRESKNPESALLANLHESLA